MPLNVGVMGVGFMGKTHADIYLKNPRAKLAAFFDFDSAKAGGDWSRGGGNLGDAKDKAFDPRTLTSHKTPDELINDPSIDIIDICLPTPHHAEFAVKALEAGKHVLCEKPMAISLADADRMVAAAEKAKGRLMVAQCMRFWPGWDWLKEAVDSKRYGEVQSAVFKRYASTPTWTNNNWILNSELSGSALFDLHIHDADYVRYVFGEPQAVFASGSGGKATRGGVDHVVATYLYKNPNLLVAAEGGWNADSSYGFTMRYTVVFEKATADFDLARNERTLQLHLAEKKEADVIELKPTTGWAEEIDYFLGCIESGKAPTVTTPADARASVALVEAELESIRKRKIVTL